MTNEGQSALMLQRSKLDYKFNWKFDRKLDDGET